MKIRRALIPIIAMCLVFGPTLAAASGTIKDGQVYTAKTMVGDQEVGATSYQAANVALEGQPEALLLLPSSATGEDAEGFDPVTVAEVQAYMNWSGKNAQAVLADLEASSLPVAWYLGMVESFDDPTQAAELLALLADLQNVTGDEEYLNFHDFLDTTGITASQMDGMLTGMGLSMEGMFERMKGGQTGFDDMAAAYQTTTQDLEALLNYDAAASTSKCFPVTYVAIMFMMNIPSMVLSIAIDMFIDFIRSLLPPASDVKVNNFKGRMLAQNASNPMQYTGGTMGASEAVTCEVVTGEGWTKLGTRAEFRVSSVFGASRTGQENQGPVYFPYIGLTVDKAEADNSWLLKTGTTKLLTRTEKNATTGQYYVELEQVGDQKRPVYYLQTSMISTRGAQAIPRSFLFRITTTQAPYVTK